MSDEKTKAYLFQWKRPEEPKPTKAEVRSNVKVFLIGFFIGNIMMHSEFLAVAS